MKTAKIIINNPSRAVDKLFSYLCSDEATLGQHVIVPFGRGNTKVDGIIVAFEETNDISKLKSIEQYLEIQLTENVVKLLLWMREKYVCTYFDCLRALLPPGSLSGKARKFSSVNAKTIKFASISDNIENVSEIVDELMIKAPAQGRTLDILSQLEQTAITDLAELAMTTRSTINSLEKKGLINISDMRIERNPFKNEEYKKTVPLEPTKEQKDVIDYINKAIDKQKYEKILLRGITGSGKTEVYLQAVEHIIELGKNAIILVPEIALTPQMSERFSSRFGDSIAIFHSALSIGERYDAWDKIKDGKVKVVVGARSAIFTPIENVGIIVIDEEHETSYKSDMTPKYDAREVAQQIATNENAVLILASATPEIVSAYDAVKNKCTLLQIKNRYNNVELPTVNVVDLRYELARGNKSFLSLALQDEIQANLMRKEQTILFINRRGFSTFVSCRKCGYTATCPQCNIALTYHKFSETLKCHYCGYEIPNYKTCPECHSSYIKYFGTGTQRIEEELKKMFPTASVIRMDNDTTRQKFSHHKILKKFEEEKIDILVGTQMITKGLDFPSVSLVGVLAADMMLYIDDYKATERTFQLITQVCGRAGRGDKRGRAVIQTYCPEHWVINCAKEQDYRSFYKKEIMLRRKLLYPPFSDIVCITVAGEKPNIVKNVTVEIAKTINKLAKEKIYNTMGPCPSPITKIGGNYRWRILIKCVADDELRLILRDNLWKSKEDVTVSLDINPNSVL